MRVFGIGWAKTGTTSLGAAFEILGLRHEGQRLDLVADLMSGKMDRIRSVAEDGETFEDWPWIILYRELDEWFPGSKFILTTRSSESWLRSYRGMLGRRKKTPDSLHRIRRFLYRLDFPEVSDVDLVRRFERHQQEVREFFKDRASDLLEVDWEKGDGWEQLCPFLGRPLPSCPFPHLNRGGGKD